MCLIFLDFDLEFFDKFIAVTLYQTSGALKWQLKVFLTLCQLNFVLRVLAFLLKQFLSTTIQSTPSQGRKRN